MKSTKMKNILSAKRNDVTERMMEGETVKNMLHEMLAI
jgi:hypothetical protein